MKLRSDIGILLTMIFKEAVGQEIILNPEIYTTPCTKDLRGNIDMFVITGTVGKNYTEHMVAGWNIFISIDLLRHDSTSFDSVCDVAIGRTGGFCSPSTKEICYCDHVNASAGTAHVIANFTAKVNYTQGIIRGSWTNYHLNRTIYSKNNLTLRAMYDVTKASLELKINGRPATGKTGSCGINFALQEDNTISLCCLNTASPCYPRLSFDGQIVASGKEKCVDYTYKPHNISYTVNATLSYSVCTQSDYFMAYSCLIKTEVTTTTWAPTLFTTTTESKQEEPTCDILCIILAVVIPVIVIAATVVAVICYCKKKKAQTSHHDSRDSTPRKESKQENGIKEDGGKNLETVDGDISNNKTDLEHASHLDKINRNQHDNESGNKNQSGNKDLGSPNKNQHEYINAIYHPDNTSQSDNISQLENTNTDQIGRKKSLDKASESKRLNSNKPRPLPQLSNKM